MSPSFSIPSTWSIHDTVVIWILVQGYAVIDPLADRTSPFLVLASYALLLCLFVLTLLRIVDKVQMSKTSDSTGIIGKVLWFFRIIGKGMRFLITPLIIVIGFFGIIGKGISLFYRIITSWFDAVDLKGAIFGHRIWEPHYTYVTPVNVHDTLSQLHSRGERSWMIRCRVALTILFLILFPFYVTLNVVVRPLRNAALVTVRESRSLALPPDFKTIKDARWNVVIVSIVYALI